MKQRKNRSNYENIFQNFRKENKGEKNRNKEK